jgi:molybdenum cofactor biosynthesis protein B
MTTESGVRVATVTVSDSRTTDTDGAGAIFRSQLGGFVLVGHLIVSDDRSTIIELCRKLIESGDVDAIVLSGGTGIAPRDTTLEAVETLLDKKLDGFGEAFRRLSWDQVGPRAILSRATAGVAGSCLLFSLPGSPRGLELGLREIVTPVLVHAVDLVRGRTHHHDAHPASAEPALAAEASGRTHRVAPGDRTVRVLYFAAVRELVGVESESLSLPESVESVGAFTAWIQGTHPALSGRLQGVRIARNETFVEPDSPIAAGDTLALIPPVAGG